VVGRYLRITGARNFVRQSSFVVTEQTSNQAKFVSALATKVNSAAVKKNPIPKFI
jgi:hypothetical protein